MKKIIILISILLLTGCSYIELNKLAIVSALGIDYKDNKYEVTAQVMDIQKTENSIKQSSLIYEATGETIGKAIRNLSEKYPKTVYLGHLEIVILGKEITEQKTNDIFDFLVRSPEIRSTGNVLVNKYQSAKNTLKPENEKENSFATEQIKSSLENATKKTGTVYLITIEELLEEYLKKGKDPVIPLIKIDSKNIDNTSNTIVSNLAVLKDNKIKKELSKKESIAYNTINNNYEDIIINPTYNNKTIGVILFNPKSKIDTKIKNNEVFTTININIETKINELTTEINPQDNKKSKELEKIITNEINSYIHDLINYCKNTKTDVLGIKNNIYKNYFKEYKKYKHEDLYKNIKIVIKPKLYRSGNINKGAI